jgi:hypothetical protein
MNKTPAVICKGRFMLDARPTESALAKSGYLYHWSVYDFDEDKEYAGLADSVESATLSALTKVKEVRNSI